MSKALTRTPVLSYTVTKKAKLSKTDEKTEKFTKLSEARKRAGQLRRDHNFHSLKNSNGVSLPLMSKALEVNPNFIKEEDVSWP